MLDTIDVENGVKMMPVFSGDNFQSIIPFPVIVEMWEKKNSGRVKREWVKQFTENERKKLAYYYQRFYRWHLVTGTPDKIVVKLSNIQLLQRACNFFGTI